MTRPTTTPTTLPLAVALLLAGATAGCTLSSVGPTIFAPAYTFQTSPAEIATAPPCARVRGVEAVDGREDKRVVGRRYPEQGGGEATISVDGGLESWLAAGADQVLTYASVARDPAAGLELRLTVAAVTVTEKTYVQSQYEGKVVLDAALLRGARETWSGRFSGATSNWGRRGNTLNYRETLNLALDRALTAVVNDPGFRGAVCGEGGTG